MAAVGGSSSGGGVDNCVTGGGRCKNGDGGGSGGGLKICRRGGRRTHNINWGLSLSLSGSCGAFRG